MTDLPISHSQSAKVAGGLSTAVAPLIALFRSALCASNHATTPNVGRRAMRRTPDEILMARTRREEARRAVDRLLR